MVFPYNIHHQALLQASRPLQRWISQSVQIHQLHPTASEASWSKTSLSTELYIFYLPFFKYAVLPDIWSWLVGTLKTNGAKRFSGTCHAIFQTLNSDFFSLGLPKSHLFQWQNPAAMRSWDDTTLLNLHLFFPNLVCAWLHQKNLVNDTEKSQIPSGIRHRWRGRGDESPPWEVGNSKKTAEFSWTKMRGAKVATFGGKILEKQRSSTKQCTIVPAQVSTSTCKISGAVALGGRPPWGRFLLRGNRHNSQKCRWKSWNFGTQVDALPLVQCSIGTDALPWDSLELSFRQKRG